MTFVRKHIGIIILVILAVLLFLCSIPAFGQAPGFPLIQDPVQPDVTLAWSAPTDTVTAGFNLFYGSVSGVYTNEINCGMTTSVNIYGLAPGHWYFFAMTAYSTAGAESALSLEIKWAYVTQVVTNQTFQVWDGPTMLYSIQNPTGDMFFVMSNSRLVRIPAPGQKYLPNKTVPLTTLRSTNIVQYRTLP